MHFQVLSLKEVKEEMAAQRTRLIGTRLALMGAALYFLEWLVIPFLPDVPTDQLGRGPQAIVDAYVGEGSLVAFAAGWFAVVLIGRVLYAIALRDSLEASGYPSTSARFAVGAMTVSVAIELVSFGAVAAGGWLAENQAGTDAIVALDAAGSIIFLLVFALIGVSTLAASLAMFASGLFRNWVCWLGIFSGGLTIVGGIIEPVRAGATGTFQELGELPNALGSLTFWVWILVTSIILWRSAPTREPGSVS
ncbi:MAG: hypothetical protein ACRDI1_00585 [Actinomycetota bacterium]